MKNIIQFPLRRPFSGYTFGLEGECEICGTTMFKAIKQQIPSNTNEFVINNYYKKDSIWPKFGVGARGGIRFNKSKNLIVIFIDTKPQKPIDDAGRNIYEDGYDSKKKLFRYTGQGQEGNQEFTRGNKWLLESKEKKSEIHLFQQESPEKSHKYIGKVRVESYNFERQKDRNGRERDVVIFWLRPTSSNIITPKSRIETIEHLDDSLIEKIDLLLTLKDDLSILPETRKYIKREYEIALRNINFRDRILKIYDHTCVICGLQLSLVEAAHIVPVSEGGTDELTNGIALCSNHHLAFDNNLIYLDKDLQTCLNSKKISNLSNSNFHSGLEEFTKSCNLGNKIKPPIEIRYRPASKYIAHRLELMGHKFD